MKTTVLRRGRVLAGDTFADDLAVVIEDGRIVAVERDPDPEAPVRGGQVDLAGGWLLPGFIDAQVNGGGGVLFNNEPSVEGIAAIAAAHRRFGTTGLLPTLISDHAPVMAKAIGAVRQAIERGVPGVLGIHLEGPYIAPARRGTHAASTFRVPASDELALAASLDNGVTLLTLAPERLPLESIRRLVRTAAHPSHAWRRPQAWQRP